MANDKSKTGDMATIRDVLGLPEQRNDIEFFLSASGNYGLEIHSDLEEFLDNFSGEDWLDDLQHSPMRGFRCGPFRARIRP
jgi:hypothetical protein